MEIAAEMVVRLQPNSFSSGMINTPGAERTPAVASRVKNVTPAITQA
jgi:hypothetical protein